MLGDNAKDFIKCASILGTEMLLYPVSSIITRFQATNINLPVIRQPFSVMAGVGSVFTSMPQLLFRLKVCDVIHPIIQEKCKF